MDHIAFERHNRQNTLHSIILLLALGLLLAVAGFMFLGAVGLMVALIVGGLVVFGGRRIAPWIVLKNYKAQPISREQSPALHAIVDELARRAELEHRPGLYYIPSPVMNAFTTGMHDNAIICVFDGLLKKLAPDEIVGVLAHEISHIRNNDTLVLGIADMVSRITAMMPYLAIFVIFGNLSGVTGIPWITLVVIFLAPLLSVFLQTMLSHSREFDADIDAVTLTRNPAALASALEKIQQYHGRMLERVLLPGRKEPSPSHSRSHPDTRERIRRLLALNTPEHGADSVLAHREFESSATHAAHGSELIFIPNRPVTARPRWRLSGLWH